MTSPPAGDGPAFDEKGFLAALSRVEAENRRLAERLANVEVSVEEVASGLDAVELAAEEWQEPGAEPAPESQPEGASQAATAPPDDAPAELDMRELITWVRDHVALLLERKLPQTGTAPHWCRSWWLHPEAIARFDAVRRCWAEAVAADGSGLVVYYEHLDRHLATLMADVGPFAGCRGGEHKPGAVRALGQIEPDPTYFAEIDRYDAG